MQILTQGCERLQNNAHITRYNSWSFSIARDLQYSIKMYTVCLNIHLFPNTTYTFLAIQAIIKSLTKKLVGANMDSHILVLGL